MRSTEFNNLIDRISAVKERSVLIVLFNECQKVFDECELNAFEFTSIIKMFLRRIATPLFGQLTNNEFLELFNKLLTRKKFVMETMPLLIYSLSDINNFDTYKFSKIVDLIDSVQDYLVVEALKAGSNVDCNSTRQDLIDASFSQTLCSFSDRLYNFFKSVSAKNAASCDPIILNYEENLLSSIKKFLLETSSSSNLSLCALIILDYSSVSKEFRKSFIDWLLEADTKLNIHPYLLLFHPSIIGRKQEEFIIQTICHTVNGKDLKNLFGDEVKTNFSLQRILTKKLLVERVLPTFDLKKRISRKIVQYFYIISDFTLIRQTFLDLIQIFVDQSNLLSFVDFEHQFHLVVCVLDFSKGLQKEDYAMLKKETAIKLADVVPEYLKLADNSRRQIGMFLTEYISNLFNTAGNDELHFDYNEDLVLADLKKISNELLFDSDNSNKSFSEPHKNTKSKKVSDSNNSKPSRVIDIRTKILDSDDDEDEEGSDGDNDDAKMRRVDKIFEEEILEHASQVQNRKYYIRDCLDTLYNEKENFKDYTVALRTLPVFIRQKAVGFDDIATELLDLMICIEDRFKIPDFQKIRKESLMLILAFHPELVSRAIRVFFSNQCSMLNRYFILNAMESAAAFLAGDADTVNEENLKKIEIVETFDRDDKSKSSKQLGKVIRQRLPHPEPKPHKNLFLNVAPQFIYPLLNVHDDKDHILLGKILATIGQMLVYARNSPLLTRIISSVLQLLPFLRGNPHLFVLSGCLFCYSSIIDALRVVDNFRFELNECFDWLSKLADTQQTKLDADLMLRNTMALTLLKLNNALFGDSSSVES